MASPPEHVDAAMMQINEIVETMETEHDRRALLKLLQEFVEEEEVDIDAKRPHRDTIEDIREFVRDLVPVSGEVSDEKVNLPTTGDFADFTAKNSMHVDSFLYDEAKMDELVEEGVLSFHYCDNCGSKRIRPLMLHSHSLPVDAMDFLFDFMLTEEECQGKALLDVGSRTGIMLYYAALYRNNLKSIAGVELSQQFCDVQTKTLEKFYMKDKVDIICGDAFKAPALDRLKSSDILIFNNVFQFFHDEDAQKAAWAQVQEHAKPGAVIISVPSLEHTFEQLGMQLDAKWLKVVPVEYPSYASDEAKMVFMYRVRTEEEVARAAPKKIIKKVVKKPASKKTEAKAEDETKCVKCDE
eukprot:TRINITY_DN27933_c0_g1_i1.p1 TRINITY_DN27933_c0_g1~~TRINITY_DN27933_c0_g1_i1.p1  ORF type:complete len:382 (+),score=170.22 TRINITY_DN27933_c0_g1_i1:87-1148(+)